MLRRRVGLPELNKELADETAKFGKLARGTNAIIMWCVAGDLPDGGIIADGSADAGVIYVVADGEEDHWWPGGILGNIDYELEGFRVGLASPRSRFAAKLIHISGHFVGEQRIREK